MAKPDALTPEQRAILRKLRDDFPAFSAKHLFIRTKQMEIKPLELNKAQRTLHDAIEEQRARTGKVRKLILKGRQQGISTYIAARFLHKTSFKRGVRTFILTHEDAATQNLFEMTERYHEHLPAVIKPATSSANAKELSFGDLDSGFRVGTAGKKAVGRSSTIQYFHGSEVAFWPFASDHFAGIIQAVPDVDGTEILLESTANGPSGEFYRRCMEAQAGIGDYELVFLPWYWQPEYARSAAGLAPTEAEKALAALYGLSLEQLAWRRAKIHDLGSEDKFKQEYPCNVQEAFIASARAVFPPMQIAKARESALPPIQRGNVINGVLHDADEGALRIWEKPVPGARYVLGGDVAEGLEKGDFSCLEVLKAPYGQQVAQWHGHIDPDLLADVARFLGLMYNAALVGIERNNHGLVTITGLVRLKYPNIFFERDPITGVQSDRAGWLTTAKTKPIIIDCLIKDLREGAHGIICVETLDEMATYLFNDKGGMEAADNCFDDRVMARAIAGKLLDFVAIEQMRNQGKRRTPQPMRIAG